MNQILKLHWLHRALHFTALAVLLVRECLKQGRKTNQEIYEHYYRPRRNPVAQTGLKRFQSPVETPNHQKSEGQHVKFSHAL